jgi:hypothetical protein
MHLKMAVPKPDELIDKFVLVLYEGKAYPGKVIVPEIWETIMDHLGTFS